MSRNTDFPNPDDFISRGFDAGLDSRDPAEEADPPEPMPRYKVYSDQGDRICNGFDELCEYFGLPEWSERGRAELADVLSDPGPNYEYDGLSIQRLPR